MINDLILRVTHNGVITDLDVDGAVPLRLDISQVDNQEIGEVFGVSSQNFNLPGTNKNNKFFNHGYLQSAVDVPGMYNTIDCSVIRNGETVLLGTLQVNDIVTSNDGFITYDVTVSSKVVEFNEALKGKFLYQGNWSTYDHILDADNIVKSWNPRSGSSNSFILDSGKTGSVYYPYIDFGFDNVFSWPEYPIISADDTIGGRPQTGSTALSGSPFNLAQVYPAIGAREVFDVIFEQAGFSYSSSFIDSNDFNEVYVLSKNKEGLGVVAAPGQESGNLFSASLAADYTLDAVQAGLDFDFTLPFTGSVYDPGSNYSTTTYYYTIPIAGDYVFQSTVLFNNSAQDSGESNATDYNLLFNVDRLNSVSDPTVRIGQTSLTVDDTDNPYSVSGQASDFFNPGDRVTVTFEVNNRESAEDTSTTLVLSGSNFKSTQAQIDYDDFPVSMSYQIDSSIKSIDMFKGLLTQFNLVAYPEQQNPSVINIETFDHWMRQGETKDWTEKYNTAKRISIKNPVSEQPRELRFSNANDDDRISKLAKESTPNFQYGTLRAISDSSLTSGEKKVESLFAPTVLAPALSLASSSFSTDLPLPFSQTSPNFIIPHLYKFNNKETESFKFKPRIGYKSYYKDSGSNSTGFSATPTALSASTPLEVESDLSSPATQYITSGSGGVFRFTNYSTLSNYRNYPVTSSTEDLLMNSSYTKLSNSSTLYPSSGSSNFNNYWKTYIDSIYDTDSRKVTLDLYFNEYEYQDIKLNDKIIIQDEAYRINKIKGFNLTRRDIVTVELLKLYPAYYPIIPPGEGTICPTVSTYPAQDITSQSMTLTGSVDSAGSGTVLERGFVYSTTDTTPTIEEGATKIADGSGVGHFDHSLTGLNPGTNYYYQAYASSSEVACDVIYGGSETVTTLTSSVCPTVYTYGPFNITSASFTMSGSATAGTSAIVERGFVVSKTDSTPTIGEGADKYPTGSGAGHFDYGNFPATASTTYYYRAYASASGCLEYGSSVTLSTSASVPVSSCNAFSASGPTNFGGACSETIDEVLYTDYSGSWPPTQGYLDAGGKITVYTSAGCSVASPNTYYAFDSGSATGTNVNAFLRVDDAVGANPGDVIQIYDCTGP